MDAKINSETSELSPELHRYFQKLYKEALAGQGARFYKENVLRSISPYESGELVSHAGVEGKHQSGEVVS